MDEDDLSSAERQMIQTLREWAGDPEVYRLTIECVDGAYEIELSTPERRKVARGVGPTLSEAWDDVAPSWA